MKRVFNTIVAVAACAVALSLAAAPGAHAQGAKVVLTAKTDAEPFVNVMVDSNQRSQLSSLGKNEMTQLFANSEWQVFDNGQIVINKEGKTVLSTGFWTNQKQSFFLLHLNDGKRIVNGTIYRSTQDMNQGFVDLFLSVPLTGGVGTVTYHVSAGLTFAPPQQPGNDGGGGGFGGFGQ